ncbi:MAG: hypothetical protein H7346_04215 [Burkholderiaceae bacterium]|nr:hypothetical protein [Burkholderiaceae bacterium]
MNPCGTQASQRDDGAGLENLDRLWRQVCASRGTPAPDAAHLAGFLAGLGALERSKLDSVLALAARGREQPGELGLISWAASCTRPSLLARLAGHGLGFTSAALFACGLALREDGWDVQARLAQLASHPEDVDTLRAWLSGPAPVEPGDSPALALLQALPLAGPERPDDAAADDAVANETVYPWPEDGHDGDAPGGDAPGWQGESMLPTRFARERPEAAASFPDAAQAAPGPPKDRLRLRLFGASAAHTLEVTAHRRGGDFLGVHVLSIDSAPALPSGEGYDWARKLVLQLTPEEMPGLIATLMGLTPSVRFGHHGARRDKFVEVRRQDGGLVIVTGEKSLSYSVPVPTATIYYLLELCCRAMAMQGDKPGRSNASDVLMLVRSAHGF